MFDLILVFGRSHEVLIAIPYSSKAKDFISRHQLDAFKNAANYAQSEEISFSLKDTMTMVLSPLVTQFLTMKEVTNAPICIGISSHYSRYNQYFVPRCKNIEPAHERGRSRFKKSRGGQIMLKGGRNGCTILGVIFYTASKNRLNCKDLATRVTNICQEQLEFVKNCLDAFIGPYWADSVKVLNEQHLENLQAVLTGILRPLSSEQRSLGPPDWYHVSSGYERLQLNPEIRKITSKILINSIFYPKITKNNILSDNQDVSLVSDIGTIEHLIILAPSTGYILSHVAAQKVSFSLSPVSWQVLKSTAKMLFLKTKENFMPLIQNVHSKRFEAFNHYVTNLLLQNEKSQEFIPMKIHFSLLFMEQRSEMDHSIILLCLEKPVENLKIRQMMQSYFKKPVELKKNLFEETSSIESLLLYAIRFITKILRSEGKVLTMVKKDILQLISFLEKLKISDWAQNSILCETLPTNKIMNDLKFYLKYMERDIMNLKENKFAITLRSFALQMKALYIMLKMENCKKSDENVVKQIFSSTCKLNSEMENFAAFIMIKCSYKVLLTDLINPFKYPGIVQVVILNAADKDLIAPNPILEDIDDNKVNSQIENWQSQILEMKCIAKQFNLNSLAMSEGDFIYTFNRWQSNKNMANSIINGRGLIELPTISIPVKEKPKLLAEISTRHSWSRVYDFKTQNKDPTLFEWNEMSTVHSSVIGWQEVQKQVAYLLYKQYEGRGLSVSSTSGRFIKFKSSSTSGMG